VSSGGGATFHGGAGVEAGAAAVQGVRGDEDRGQARMLVPQDVHGEEQALRRRPSHHREVPGALQAALLHPTRQVSAPSRPRATNSDRTVEEDTLCRVLARTHVNLSISIFQLLDGRFGRRDGF